MDRRLVLVAGLALALGACGGESSSGGGGGGSPHDARVGNQDLGPPLDEGVAQPDAAPPACGDGDRRCSDGGVIELCARGEWAQGDPCRADETCADGHCRQNGCAPMCDGRTCGPDGCGGVCGMCPEGQVCGGGGQCVDMPAQCGDHQCGADEDCSTCPADCGQCCGDGTCDADRAENCATCLADCACAQGQRCNPDARACEAVCVPQCDGLQCGDDGCGGQCGQCNAGEACQGGHCACVPQCDGRQCGNDGCGGSCGDCGANVCSADGRCVAPPAHCGDHQCNEGEDCATCPADCGQCCGDHQCTANHGENCGNCPADCGCGAGQSCDVPHGRCQCVPQCDGRACGDNGCGGSCGQCGDNQRCDADGACQDVCVPQCLNRECGDDGCDGSCGPCAPGDSCNAAGQCEAACSPMCDGRACGDNGCGGSCGDCPHGDRCTADGRCVPDACDCDMGEVCLEGICRAQDLLCSADNPTGLCANAQDCVAGECRDSGAGCSQANPTGICPVGEVCRNAACAPFDAQVLCDDANPCTADLFDFARNRCAHEPTNGMCSDGNECTTDVCVEGACQSQRVGGCIEPPQIDPVTSPTNDPHLHLHGTKPAGSSVEINGMTAVPESPDAQWSVDINLHPGENVFTVRTVDHGQRSAAREVRVVYDIDAPTLAISPDGGVFLDGVTVTVAASEPARVYFSTDGSTPDTHSDSFRSARSFRIFDDTTLRFLAVDDAGNWMAAPVDAHFEITGHGNRWHAGTHLPESYTLVGAASIGDTMYVVGGSDGRAPQAGAYAYDLSDDMWTDLPALSVARTQHALVAFSDGDLYTFGGENSGVPMNNVERLHPGVDMAWQARRPMPSTRFGLAAAVVGTKVYTFGGKTNGDRVLTTVEVYDPAADTWTNQVAQMPRARYGARAVAVNGVIYLVGGEDAMGRPIADMDVYDPAGDAWHPVAPLPTPRSFAAVGVNTNAGNIGGGYTGIVVAGGRLADGRGTAIVEEYVIDDDAWRTRTPLARPRHSAASVWFDAPGPADNLERRVWIIGGLAEDQITDDVSWWSQTQDYLRPLQSMPAPRFMHGAAVVDGRIYLTGGRDFQEERTLWAFDPETETYQQLPDLPTFQNGLSFVSYDGVLYAIGGANNFGVSVPTVRRFDPVSGTWEDREPMITARRDAATAVVDGRVYVVGGYNNGPQQAVEIYDPAQDQWAQGPVLPEPRTGAVAVARDGELWVFGGTGANDQLVTSVLELGANGHWEVQPGSIGTAYAAAVLVGDDRIAVIGGRDANGPVRTIWSYDASRRTLAPADSSLVAPLDRRAVAFLDGDLYLFGGNANAMPGPEGVPTVQKLRGECYNGVVDARETQSAFDPLRISGGGCGNADPRWFSSGAAVNLPADPQHFVSMHDFDADGSWGDGGGDAFDSYGIPFTLSQGNATVNLSPAPAAARVVNVGGLNVTYTSDFPNQNLLRLRFEPPAMYDGRHVTIQMQGNLGSDSGTQSAIRAAAFQNQQVSYLVTVQGSFQAPGDAPVTQMVVPALAADLGRVSYSVAGDNVTVRVADVQLPVTMYIAVSYVDPAQIAAAILSDIVPR